MQSSGARSRTLTQKGEAYFYSMFEKQFQRLKIDLLRKINLVDNLTKCSTTEPAYLRKELKVIDDIQNQIWLIYEKAKKLFSTKILKQFDETIEKLEHEAFFVRSLAVTFLKESESEDKKSISSHRSNKSSTCSQKVIDEEVELAALKVRRKFAAKRDIPEQLNKIDEEIAVHEAKIEVYKGHVQTRDPDRPTPHLHNISQQDNFPKESLISTQLQQFENKSSRTPHTQVAFEKLNLSDPDNFAFNRSTVPSNNSIYAGQEEVSREFLTPKSSKDKIYEKFQDKLDSSLTIDKICEVLQTQSAPTVDLETFNGDPLEFKFFLTNFEEIVEKRIKDPMGRLTRLIKFTSGDAKELIKGCIYQKEKGYERAKQLLSTRYGDPHIVLSSYSRELRSWKTIKTGDSEGLRKYFIFLLRVSGIVRGHYWNTLDSVENLSNIVSKLPLSSRDRWNRNVFRLRKDKLREPDLDDLVTFVDEELTLASDPLFSREAIDERNSLSNSAKPVKTLFTSIQCQLCNNQHDIEECPLFKDQDIKEKISLIMRARLCFGCYNKGHCVSDCNSKRICKNCKKSHPTGLHE